MYLPISSGNPKKSTIVSTKKDAGKDYSDSDSSHPKKWIQSVVSSPDFERGAFTRQAASYNLTPIQFMEKVLANPDDYNLTTRRRAQFLKNIQRK